MLVSLAHAVLKGVGSLFLTVAILVFLVALLLWGTVVEKNYGATAAKFGIYGAWWFNALGLILGLNSAAALVLRWPWKRHQLGFVLPHFGLIVLLVGCFLSRHYGIEATLSVFEGESSNVAYKGADEHPELDGQQQFYLQVLSANSPEKTGDPITVPFTSGPFNWDDYRNGKLSFLPWSLVNFDRGILYDRDGIRLEVLDYLSNSAIVKIPNLSIRATPLGPDGRELSGQAEDYELSVTSVAAHMGSFFSGRRFGVGAGQTMGTGQRILFWMSDSAEETAAFRQSQPQGPLGKLGRVVLYAGGKPYDLSLSDWTPATRRPLGDSGFEAELVGVGSIPVDPRDPARLDTQVRLNIHRRSSSHPLVISAEYPQMFTFPDYEDKVFGTYWAGTPDKPSKDSKAKSDPAPTSSLPRIDFLLGANQELCFRTWRAGKVMVSAPLKIDEIAAPITAFRDTPDAVVLRLTDFQPAREPGFSARAVPFDSGEVHLRQAYVQLTVDGQSERFWIPCSSFNPVEKKGLRIPRELQKKMVAGRGRRVELSFAPESFDIGYAVFVHKAWRKLDPGTRQPSFYGSEVDLVPSEARSSSAGSRDKRLPQYENLLVTLNAPLDFADPAFSGRSYRMFQSRMDGLYNPEEFDRKPGESVYLSGFKLNYDPGRGLTYVGCLLIVAGIFVAYFVRFVVPNRSAAPIVEPEVQAEEET